MSFEIYQYLGKGQLAWSNTSKVHLCIGMLPLARHFICDEIFGSLSVPALERPHLRDVLFQVLDAFPFEEHSRDLDAVRPG